MFKAIYLSVFFLVMSFASTHLFAASTAVVGVAKYSELKEGLFLVSLSAETRSEQDLTAESLSVGAIHEPSILERAQQLEFKFLRSVSTRKFSLLMKQGAAINNTPERVSENAQSLGEFGQQFPGRFMAGDRLLMILGEDGVFYTQLNGVDLGSQLNESTFRLLLSGFLGDVPPSRAFRDALSGESDSIALQAEFAAQFNNVVLR
ncbi:MAG: hypothetical protein ACI93R_000996 [Flavobacteriales bacterium]|jgi:hypothetical protein